MIRLFRRVLAGLRSPRIRGFLSMSGATLFAQGLTLALLPILSRLYSPADFGVLSFVLAISGVATPALALKFDAAAILPDSRRAVRPLVTLALLSILVASLGWSVLANHVAPLLFNGESVRGLAWWVFGVSFLTGLFNLFSQLAIRDRRYSSVAKRSLYQSGATSFAQVVAGSVGAGSAGLLGGALVGRTAGLVGLARGGRKYFGRHRAIDVPAALRAYWRFPVVFAPSAVLNGLGLHLPVIVLTSVYGAAFAGQLGMAERIVAAPITVIGVAMGQVFVGELAQMRRDGQRNFLRWFMQVSGALGLVSLLGVFLLLLAGDFVVPWLLGSNWDLAADLALILAFSGGARLVATPLSRSISFFQRAGANVAIDLVRTGFSVISVALVVSFDFSATGATWVMYGPLAVVYVITWFYLYSLMRRESRK